MALLAYPFLPLPKKARKYSTFYALRYDAPHNKKNILFVLLAFVVFCVVILCRNLLQSAGNFVYNLPFMSKLYSAAATGYNAVVSLLGKHISFILFAVTVVVINIVILYGYSAVKGFVKKVILDRVFNIKKEKEKKTCFLKRLFDKLFKRKKKGDTQRKTEDNDKKDIYEDDEKNKRIPKFEHSDETDDENLVTDKTDGDDGTSETKDTDAENDGDDGKEEEEKYNPVYKFFCGLIFEGEDFEFARGWAVRVYRVLQTFVYLVEIAYAILFLCIISSVFFELPNAVYTVLLDVLRIDEWYLYPFISVIFLQEICNFLKAPALVMENEDEEKKKKSEEEDRIRDARLRALQSELKKRFDSEHFLRYYCEAEKTDVKEYEFKSKTYASALKYIKKYMKEASGNVVQSYMECLDAVYNDNHVYFAASFYSEFGEYLIAYTYIRLLSGARMIFVVSSPDERESLKKYISDRLMKMTGSSRASTWRVYTADERLDQADVLIASPSDFEDDNMVEQFPGFFEEAANAIFIDADKMIALDSYLCLIMARRLQKVTNDRLRFIFLSLDLLKGFATSSLPKFFCIDSVLSFSSAAENEEVSYTLWQKESQKNRIYNRSGQKPVSLECILAELACEYGVDGVRLISDAPLGHAEKQILALHNVEVNNMYKDVADINYMIYSDERCNLSAALYACMRFRGKKRSILHILSKPYLLREYFMFKAAYEMYVNRSSFIKPRVTEHADRQKLSLLRVFCDATSQNGIPVSEFEERVRGIISISNERGDKSTSRFCREMISSRSLKGLSYKELAAYLVAGLCDGADCDEEHSYGTRAKDFYLVIDTGKRDGSALFDEKCILFNRAKEVFDRLLTCNRRVELCLNDEIIGMLDTFPSRVHLEYISGQSITYNNAEYEIEHISEDGSKIFLRSENTNIKNCLDTVLLRRYTLNSLNPHGAVGVLHNTKSVLKEIQVTECNIDFVGETYGFYSLMTDRQTLDFYRGVEGNPHVENKHVREIHDGKALLVTLTSKNKCTDGMRMLLSAVFNEFIRTLFPMAYHCVAICPVLMIPLTFDDEHEPLTESERISALYPYLKTPSSEFVETDENRMQFVFINDCEENIGVLDWFYDQAARYMQEFLANVYSYLHWLKKNADRRKHYIYFGGESMPECYDLDGCCELLSEYNLILSDDGKKDYETAGEDEILEETERCAFCHRIMENGRYSLFDSHRYICADCFDVVDTHAKLQEHHMSVMRYLADKYPEIRFGSSSVDLDKVYDLNYGEVLSEYYYRLDYSTRTVFVERDDPETNVEVSILRGIIELWQTDNDLLIDYSRAQLYFEELLYLRSLGKNESVEWIYNALDDTLRACVDEIAAFVGESLVPVSDSESEDGEKVEDNASKERHTSFEFMRNKCAGLVDDDDYNFEFFDDEDDKTAERLYDPNKMPRFWKRYLKNQHIDDGKDEELPELEDTGDNLSDNADDSDGKTPDNDADDVTDGTSDDTAGNEPDKTEPEEEQTPEKKKDKKSKDKKEGFFSKLFRRKKKDGEKKGGGKRRDRNGNPVGLFTKLSPGEKIVPYEDDEAKNKLIRLYNEIARVCFNYSDEAIPRKGITDEELARVFRYVIDDYPEIFWVTTFAYTPEEVVLKYRCLNSKGQIDTKQINEKRNAIRKGAKKFTSGITRFTDPYKALLKIYRKVILTLDYDGKGLDAGVGEDMRSDDSLRSLYSALVEHKVVCAGYAVAMQYLLQSVGIVCGYVISESQGDVCHAFNIVKIGREVYYVDATWGDMSNTKTGIADNGIVLYNHFCVPYREFTLSETEPMHIPRKILYPSLETFGYTKYEFFRYHKAYLTRYNEEEIIRIFADAAATYKPKNGTFVVGMRFINGAQMEFAKRRLVDNGELASILVKASQKLAKNKKAAARLAVERYSSLPDSKAGTLYFIFDDVKD